MQEENKRLLFFLLNNTLHIKNVRKFAEKFSRKYNENFEVVFDYIKNYLTQG